MIDQAAKQALSAALDRLSARAHSPRVLVFSAEDRAGLESAVERVRNQWLGPTQPVLTVALAGGTGVGKSTLINALAGHVIAEASEIRPTTRHLQVYHHRDDALGNLPEEAAGDAAFVAHERPELRFKLIVDAPDLDSFVVRHRETTKALLRRSGLVLYVFSPERYLEERTWSVLRQETVFSATAAVLNKVDRAGSPDELEQITQDLREHFAELGRGQIRMFRVCAAAHVPDSTGALPSLHAAVDEMAALRAFIERELHASEIARLLREQRMAGVVHLREELDRLAPAAVLERLRPLQEQLDARIVSVSSRLVASLAEPLAEVEAELVPRAALHRHRQFWGPFRVWLSIVDFLGYGLTHFLRRSLEPLPADRANVIGYLLARSGSSAPDDVLRHEADGMQDVLFSRGLPVERWRQITAKAEGGKLVEEVGGEIEKSVDSALARLAGVGHAVIWAASTIGGLVPAAMVVVGLVVMTFDVFRGNYVGFALLGHLLAMLVLFFVVLQGIVSTLLPSGARWVGPSLGADAVHRIVERTLKGWAASYRADLEADLADLREPLAVFEACARDGERTSEVELPASPPHAGLGERKPT